MIVNALKIRQSFGAILKKLQKTNEPIIIEKGRKTVAVLISIEVFNQRFIDFQDAEKKAAVLKAFSDSAVAVKENSLKVLRDIRYG